MASDDKTSSGDDFLKVLLALGVAAIKTRFKGKKLWRVLKESRAQLVQDYSGGSSLSQRSQTLSLYEDDTFRLRDKTFRAITGGGISPASEEIRQISGTWTLKMSEDQLYLMLDCNDGTFIKWTVEEREKDVFYVDGQRWKWEDL